LEFSGLIDSDHSEKSQLPFSSPVRAFQAALFLTRKKDERGFRITFLSH